MRFTFQIYQKYSDRFAWRCTSSPAMAAADGGTAGNAGQQFCGEGAEQQAMPGSRFATLGGAALRAFIDSRF